MVSVPKLWPNSTVVCIGGGPSLTVEDVNYCEGKARVIAINNAYLLAPWADILYAADSKWFKWQYRDHAQAIDAFPGPKYSLQPDSARWPGVQVLKNTGERGLELKPTGLRAGRNSGYQAINLSIHLGAARIVLMGYDMSIGEKGRAHWHDEHPDRLRSPYSAFRQNFETIVAPLKELGIEVINCSRRSALKAFPMRPLEEALQCREVAA